MSEELARQAYALEERIVATVRNLRANWVTLAGYLYQFKEGRCWEVLGYGGVEQWLASPDIELSRTVFFNLTESYREFVIERGVEPEQLARADMTKIRATLPALRRGFIDATDAIADAEALTVTDLEEKYRARHPINGQEPLIAPDLFHYEKCPTCGGRMKVPDA